MEHLTDKQRKAREYYAQNAERIKQQKLNAYAKSKKCTLKSAKSVEVDPVQIESIQAKTIQIKKVKAYKTSPAKTSLGLLLVKNPSDDRKEFAPEFKDRKVSARQRIEDRRIEREAKKQFAL